MELRLACSLKNQLWEQNMTLALVKAQGSVQSYLNPAILSLYWSKVFGIGMYTHVNSYGEQNATLTYKFTVKIRF